MTRSWQFTLITAATWYNLWDLISTHVNFTDPTFTYSPFMPGAVCEIEISSSNGDISVSEDFRNEVGIPLPLGNFYRKAASTNKINLKDLYLSAAADGGIVNVAIIA